MNLSPPIGVAHALSDRELPMQFKFLIVCTRWRNIALSTPQLWASLHLVRSTRVEALKLWLQRAGDHPFFSITFDNCLTRTSGLAGVLRQYADRIQNLTIFDPEDNGQVRYLNAIAKFPRLERLMIVGAENMDVSSLPHVGFTQLANITDLLSLAPNIVTCTFFNVLPWIEPLRSPTILVLPRLVTLTLGDEGDYVMGRDQVMECLALPGLQTLSLPFTAIDVGEFSRFLKRSTPPLEKLTIGGNADMQRFNFTETIDCFRIIPSLAHLELHTIESPFASNFFTALADSSVLPNLRTLTVGNVGLHAGDFEPNTWSTLFRMLPSRRFDSFRLDTHRSPPRTTMCTIRDDCNTEHTLRMLYSELSTGVCIGIVQSTRRKCHYELVDGGILQCKFEFGPPMERR
ncbi:hypothetical protein B0H16DRAFT_1471048 [Mycena metata]|uniref:F-box domain-containing protein n=1 Tax=Mycena metata TaxID=1033252 RepID=A0AAD7MQA6_9AGAR|nr:hypothetical protein B0H16DRAFT_1471048 [Mycena metata]